MYTHTHTRIPIHTHLHTHLQHRKPDALPVEGEVLLVGPHHVEGRQCREECGLGLEEAVGGLQSGAYEVESSVPVIFIYVCTYMYIYPNH
jgi:hypothetical protein